MIQVTIIHVDEDNINKELCETTVVKLPRKGDMIEHNYKDYKVLNRKFVVSHNSFTQYIINVVSI